MTKIEAISYLVDHGWHQVSENCWLHPGWEALSTGELLPSPYVERRFWTLRDAAHEALSRQRNQLRGESLQTA